MGLWHDIKIRLGLADEEWDEEYYDDEDEYADDPAEAESDWADSSSRRGYGSAGGGASIFSARHFERDPDLERDHGQRDYGHSGSSLHSVPTGAASVTGVTPQVRVHIAEPKSFTDAQSIADRFRQGTPVILNLTATKADVAKRMLDFASGLTYGLGGGLQKVSEKVFMLTPHNVEVSDAERRRLRDNGLFSE